MSGFGLWHALVYDTASGTISSLGLEGTGAASSAAYDLNDKGDVVGSMSFGGYPDPNPPQERAFLATHGQVFLNDLLPSGSDWVLKRAVAINDAGEIVGVGYRTSSPDLDRGFLLTVALTPTQLTARRSSIRSRRSSTLAR